MELAYRLIFHQRVREANDLLRNPLLDRFAAGLASSYIDIMARADPQDEMGT